LLYRSTPIFKGGFGIGSDSIIYLFIIKINKHTDSNQRENIATLQERYSKQEETMPTITPPLERDIRILRLRQARSSGQPIRLRIISPSDAEKDLFTQLQWSDYWIKYELIKALGRLPDLYLTDYQPHVVLHLFGFPMQLDPRIYTIGWIYGHPELVTDIELARYDHIFCYSSLYQKELEKKGIKSDLLLGATGKLPRPRFAVRHTANFVGNARPQGGLRPAVQALLESGEPFTVWGKGWERFVPQKNLGGAYYDYSQLDELYASSEFTLNDHHPDMAKWGFVSFRIYDALASGGFVVSDRNPCIAEIFEDTVPQFSDGKELKEIFRYFRAHPEEKERLRRRGMEIALSHSWEARAEQIHWHLMTISDPALQHINRKSLHSTSAGEIYRRRLHLINRRLEECELAEQIRPSGGASPASGGLHLRSGFGAGRPRVFFIDWFRTENASLYWLKALRRIAEVDIFHLKEDLGTLQNKILDFNPDHIHLGGSVKNGIVPLGILQDAKARSGCSLSAFYSDAVFSGYHMDLAKIADAVYITNTTHIALNAEKELKNFIYLPPPVDPDVFRPVEGEQIYDLLFIGNNTSPSRLRLLQSLAQNYRLIVAGSHWEETGLNHSPGVYGEEFSNLCGKAKISLSLVGDEWRQLGGYFSSRLTQCLACGAFTLQTYTPGLEKLFTQQKHLVWYQHEKELYKWIDYYLPRDEERTVIARQGRTLVLDQYTFDLYAKRILAEGIQQRMARSRKIHVAGWAKTTAPPPTAKAAANVQIAKQESHKKTQKFNIITIAGEDLFASPIFIVGFHHSGTRLLAQLLHNYGVFQVVDRPTYEWGYIQNLNSTILPEWNIPEAVRNFDGETGARHISPGAIFDMLQRKGYKREQYWLHKDPRTCATLSAWLCAFPEAKVVHIVRDPLDVLGTLPDDYTGFTPEKKSPQEALPFWADLWTSYLENVLKAAPQAKKFVEIRFEDLQSRPEREIARLVGALGLPDVPGSLDTKGIQAGKVGIYKKWIADGRLDTKAVELMKIVLGEYRKKYGYDARSETVDGREVSLEFLHARAAEASIS
jgi:hypothetical protein